MIKPKSYIMGYLYSFLLMVFLVSLVFVFFWINAELRDFQMDSEQFRKDYLVSRKELIKSEVENAVRYIEYEQSRAEAGMKRDGKYIDDEEKVIQKEILESFEKFYFIGHGYLFGGDWNGISLFGPSKGQNMLEIGGGRGSDKIRNFIDTARSGGGYVEYEIPYYNNDSDIMLKRISYISGIDELQWYIGSGLLVNEIEEVILKKQETSNRRIKDLVMRIVSFIIAFMLITFILLFIASRKIKNNLEVFRKSFETAATEKTLINVDKLSFKEAKVIAASANNMVIERQKVLDELKKREAENALLEQKLLRAQKMEAIGLMAGGVAHDLNNILSGIVGYPDLIMMSLDEDSEIRPHVEAIKRSGLRAADVVADLLTIAKGVASTRKPCSLNGIIDQYFESPEYEKLNSRMENINLVKNYDRNLFNISCSEVHIKKCVMNLVMNAVEAMENIGELTISTRNQYVDTPFSTGQYMEKGEYAVLSVKDTGHGIADEDRERIFDPFYTKKVMGMSGTGLGLSVVWNTVQDHNGGIIVNSTENGTTFELFFPVDRNVTVDDFQSEEVVDIMGEGEKILIIDDESLQQEIAAGMLDFLGYWTHSVSSGKEAVLWLETNTVDILLLDMIMPSGLSGLQTYKEILTIHPGQKAIIASGYSQNKDVENTLKLGAGRFIKKPYTIDVLGKAMKNELKKK